MKLTPGQTTKLEPYYSQVDGFEVKTIFETTLEDQLLGARILAENKLKNLSFEVVSQCSPKGVSFNLANAGIDEIPKVIFEILNAVGEKYAILKNGQK